MTNLEEAATTLNGQHDKCECVKAKVSKLPKMKSGDGAADKFLGSVFFHGSPEGLINEV